MAEAASSFLILIVRERRGRKQLSRHLNYTCYLLDSRTAVGLDIRIAHWSEPKLESSVRMVRYRYLLPATEASRLLDLPNVSRLRVSTPDD